MLTEYFKGTNYRYLIPTGAAVSVVGTGNGRFERTPNEGAAGLAAV